jgi:PleD family two-component response regulator
MYRDWDVAACYGGEKFAIILPNTDGPGAAAIYPAIY